MIHQQSACFKYLVCLDLLLCTCKSDISKNLPILLQVLEGVSCAGIKVVAGKVEVLNVWHCQSFAREKIWKMWNIKHLFGLQNYHCLISDNLFKEFKKFYWQILVSLMNSRAEGSNGVKVAKTRWAQSWLETNWAGLLLMIQSPLIKNTDKTIVHSVGELNLRLLS